MRKPHAKSSFVEPSTFARLMAGVEEVSRDGASRGGAAGPCLLFRDRPDRVWACGGRIGPLVNVTQLLAHGGAATPSPPRDVDYLPGACLLMSREACERVGLLDEHFFCYLEDADWCVRVREAGLRVVVVPQAIAYHGASTSTGGGYSAGRKYMTGVNSVRFLRKHGSVKGWLGLLVFDLLLWPLALLRAVLTGRVRGAVAKLQGVLAGLLGAEVDEAVAARFGRRPS